MAPLSDEAIGRLAHLNFAEFCRELARWSGAAGAIDERDGVLLMDTASSFPPMNAVLRVHDAVPAEAVIDRAEAWFAGRGHGFVVLVRDAPDGDADLVAAAEARGFVAITDSPEMICRVPVAEATVPDGIELRWVTDLAGVADLVAVSDTAYESIGMPVGTLTELMAMPERLLEPHLANVVAYDGDRPVAAAQTLLSHGIAGVYYVGVVPDARGRGLADLVTRAVTNRGFDLGAAVQTLQASPLGEAIYRRMGWQEVYRHRRFMRF